jgi:hypothetical protein
MDSLTPTLTVLSAMITPVVVISACASLIISTSARGDRTVDRLYHWSAEFEELADGAPASEDAHRRREMIFQQLDQLTSRTRLLQRSLAASYLALGLFVATSVAIGVAAVAVQVDLQWQYLALLPIGLGLIGAGCLFYGCLLLVAEAQMALTATEGEMDFVWQQGQRYAPGELLERRERCRRASFWPFASRGAVSDGQGKR